MTAVRATVVVALGAFIAACGGGGAGTGGASGGGSGGGGTTMSSGGTGGAPSGAGAGGGGVAAGASGGVGGELDAGAGGASAPDAGPTTDAAGEVASGAAPLTQLLRIIRVAAVQGAQNVTISIDRQKQGYAALHAGQALMMRIHVRPDTGWVVHPTVCELHVVSGATDVTLSATRSITGASSEGVLDSTFNFDLTAAQVAKGLQFSVALRDPTGAPANPPPAIQRALYPMDGTLDTLAVQ